MNKAIKKGTFGVYDVLCRNCLSIYHLSPKSIVKKKKGKTIKFRCECGEKLKTL